MADWQTNNGLFTTNYLLHGDGFSISYNPLPGGGLRMFMADDGGDETAIVQGDNFFILNGDFREQYAELIEHGFDACLAFYESQKAEHGSSWSSVSNAGEAVA